LEQRTPEFEPAKRDLMACAYELVPIDFERPCLGLDSDVGKTYGGLSWLMATRRLLLIASPGSDSSFSPESDRAFPGPMRDLQNVVTPKGWVENVFAVVLPAFTSQEPPTASPGPVADGPWTDPQ
jgi:hypothetical protein